MRYKKALLITLLLFTIGSMTLLMYSFNAKERRHISTNNQLTYTAISFFEDVNATSEHVKAYLESYHQRDFYLALRSLHQAMDSQFILSAILYEKFNSDLGESIAFISDYKTEAAFTNIFLNEQVKSPSELDKQQLSNMIEQLDIVTNIMGEVNHDNIENMEEKLNLVQDALENRSNDVN
ncbi:hypothetical protein [Longirhabdus pacifica]|uniref:hypothetical protein n=1 Tax=Longirhabdus pacifica TaxID=2305227 RepID=UPI00100913A1|nr:hypothetical protein [Longirhabdus pacifica]